MDTKLTGKLASASIGKDVQLCPQAGGQEGGGLYRDDAPIISYSINFFL